MRSLGVVTPETYADLGLVLRSIYANIDVNKPNHNFAELSQMIHFCLMPYQCHRNKCRERTTFPITALMDYLHRNALFDNLHRKGMKSSSNITNLKSFDSRNICCNGETRKFIPIELNRIILNSVTNVFFVT